MAQTLSQEEIDALRDAVKSGGDLGESSDDEKKSDQIKVAEYNFKRPQIISGDHFHALRLAHEAFANSLRSSLFALLKTPVEIKMVAADQMTYGEFVMSLSNPSHFAVISTMPNIGEMQMDMSLSVATSIIDILLGGNGAFSFDNRGLTALEQDILKGVHDALAGNLKTAWSNIADITFNLTQLQSNPEFITLTRPETPCLTATFDMHIGELAGVLTFCYPAQIIISAFAQSEERTAKKKITEADKAQAGKTREAIANVQLELSAVIGPTSITTQQVESLKPGDIINLGRRINKPVDVYIGTRKAYAAELGQYDGRTAACLIGPHVLS